MNQIFLGRDEGWVGFKNFQGNFSLDLFRNTLMRYFWALSISNLTTMLQPMSSRIYKLLVPAVYLMNLQKKVVNQIECPFVDAR